MLRWLKELFDPKRWVRLVKQEPPRDPIAEIRQVEADCLRRLDFVDAQVDRLSPEKQHRWSSAMTIVEADIMPLGRKTQVMTAAKNLPRWKWQLIVVSLGVLALTLLVILLTVGCSTIPVELGQ